MIQEQSIQSVRNEIVIEIANLISKLEGLRKVDGEMPIWVMGPHDTFYMFGAYMDYEEGNSTITICVDRKGSDGYVKLMPQIDEGEADGLFL